MVGRLLVSLAVVLGLMWVIARRLKRPGRGKSSRLIDVLGRQQLSRTASVALVRVLDQALILGITDAQVTVLGDTDLASVQERLAEASRPRTTTGIATAGGAGTGAAATDAGTERRPSGPLAGSALSASTWRQTVEAMRDLTARHK